MSGNPQESSVVKLSARELAEFLLRSGSIDSRHSGVMRAQEGARIHRRLQAACKKQEGSDYQSEVYLKGERKLDGLCYQIDGRADGIFTSPDGIRTIDEIKTVEGEVLQDSCPEHWAQARIYAALLCELEGLSQVRVQLTYFRIDLQQTVIYTEEEDAAWFENYLIGLLTQYSPWARREDDWRRERTASLSQLVFPFERYRPGQREMAGEIFRTFRDGRILLCQAPTGTGKSMSSIFPALKAMGEGYGDRVFYLTARGTAAYSAEKAVGILRSGTDSPLRLKNLTLTSKEKLCFLEQRSCTPEDCPYANGYYDRLRAGIAAALEQDSFTREEIERLAKEHTLCPFEFQLDLSLWCDLIVGDYNYLFDPKVSLRRFFESGGDYLFLVDEAHNLPDRARDMYSASLRRSDFSEAAAVFGRKKPKVKKLMREMERSFDRLREIADEEENRTFFQDAPPESFTAQLAEMPGPFQEFLDKNREGEEHDAVLNLYFLVMDFLRVADGYDSHYITQASAYGRDTEITLLCLDPSDFLSDCFSLGRGGVLFSATLSPPGFYRDVCGCGEARCVSPPSPFPRHNLGLYIAGDVSTKYRDREKSAPVVAEYLYAMTAGKTGNYMVYFPSYAYLTMVLELFEEAHPEIVTLVQQPGMDDAAREEFLSHFSETPDRTLLGFGVMGGVFGEGIDLTGERLIGTAVVGVGLPMVSPRQEKLREYMENRFGSGFDYAYRFPGMNRVLQAAGRVIRTAVDRGVVLLLDDRYLTAGYRMLCPPHWNGAEIVRSPEQLYQLEEDFWERKDESGGNGIISSR